MKLADLISSKYKVVFKSKSLGLIKWDGKQWDLSNLPKVTQKKLTSTNINFFFTKKPKKGIFTFYTVPLTPENPLWAFQLLKVLAISNSSIQLTPPTKVARGGPGSGFFGHLGRPGLRGGSKKTLYHVSTELSKHLQEERTHFLPQIRKVRSKLSRIFAKVPSALYEKCPVKKVTLATSRDFFEKQMVWSMEENSYTAALHKAFQKALKKGETKAKVISEFEKEEYKMFMKHYRVVGLAEGVDTLLIDVTIPHNLDHVVLHEYGHLVDEKFKLSAAPFWKDAIAWDIEGLIESMRVTYGGKIGPTVEQILLRYEDESFADAFSLYAGSLGSRGLLKSYAPRMYKVFDLLFHPWRLRRALRRAK